MLLDIPAYYLTQISLLYGIISMEDPIGKQLPSRFQLSHIYNTSENTIRKALAALQKQGIINHGKGHAPRILFNPSNSAHWRCLQTYYPIQTGKISEIVDALRLIIPPFFLLGLAHMDRNEVTEFLQKIRAILDGPQNDFWPLSCFYLATLLHSSQNSTITYYYIITQLSLHCAFNTIPQEYRNRVVASRKKLYQWIAQQIQDFIDSGQAPSIGKLSNVFDWYYQQIEPPLQQAVVVFPDKCPQPLFIDFQQKYMQVCFEMAHRIFSGDYGNGSTLPSDTVCAATFDVAITTSRRAYQLLGHIGLAQAVARVGTQAQFPPAQVQPIVWTKKETDSLYLTFIDHMEFFRRHIRRLAFLSAQRNSMLAQHLYALDRSSVSQNSYYLFFLEFTLCIMQNYGNNSYMQYFKLMRSLLYFGLSSLDQVVHGCVKKVCKDWIESIALLEKGESAQFAAKFSCGWKEICYLASESFPHGGCISVTPFPVWKIEKPMQGESHRLE